MQLVVATVVLRPVRSDIELLLRLDGGLLVPQRLKSALCDYERLSLPIGY